jgi:metal-responsive CopG/Arc/MetJ family transcriptional regulator
MATERVRTHIMVPRDLLAQIDGASGNRQRSDYVVEAVREKLSRDRLAIALKATAGVLDLADYPEWSTPEKVSEWVHQLRKQDGARPQPDERADQ